MIHIEYKHQLEMVKTVIFVIVNLISMSNCVRVSIPLHLSRISNSNLQSMLSNRYNSIEGQPGEGYFISLLIGTPSQKINVLIDTGSSNFAIACQPHLFIENYFHKNDSTTFRSTNTKISVPYTMGKWSGYLATDIVKMINLPPVKSDIACITDAENFFINGSQWQGILGMAYTELARPPNTTVPLFDTMVKKNNVSNVFSMQLCGEHARHENNAGILVLGGVDRTLYADQIRYTPLKQAWYYEVVLTSLGVGNKTLDVDCKELNNDKSIVDSGTTNLRLPKLVFEKLILMLEKELDFPIPHEFWYGTKFVCSNFSLNFPDLRLSLIHSFNSTFTLIIAPKQYLRPVKDFDGKTENTTCYKFAITSSRTGTVLGAVIMEGFYVVFDRQNSRIGFAKSSCNKNDYGPEIEGPTYHKDPWSCTYQIQPSRTLQVLSYVLIALSVFCVIPLIAMLIQWGISKWRNRKMSRLVDTNSILGE